MPRSLVDYSPDESPRRRWRWELWVIIALVVGTIILPAIPACRVKVKIDSVTGSMATQTVSSFGLFNEIADEVSPLELWMHQHGETWEPDWWLLDSNTHYLFGRSYFGGSRPPIHFLLPMLGDFIAASTDEEVRAFVRVMESGSDEEQEAAVEEAKKIASQNRYDVSVP